VNVSGVRRAAPAFFFYPTATISTLASLSKQGGIIPMSEFIVSFPNFDLGEHEREVQAAIQAAVLAALAGLPQPDPKNPGDPGFSSGAFYMPPRHWLGIIILPADAVATLPELANSTLTVTRKPSGER
jgi:hypothetical protein